MHELKPNPLRDLLVIVMPTLAALVAADPATAVRLLETATWVPSALAVRTVLGFRDGQPVGLVEDIDIPAGYVPVYGLTPAGVALAASEHASRVHEEAQELEAYWAAMRAVGAVLAVTRQDVEDATARYRAALAEAAR
jgi:hypothetical protein